MDTSRNIYKDDVDFQALALHSPEFAKHLKKNGQLDFSDPDAVQQLTKSLLKRDFNLELELPDDRLCPPVPNRLNYILWVQSLLDTTNPDYTDTYDPDREVVGLDIGTGASCIYPLLGCTLRPSWKFGATDIDDKSLHYARANIARNSLGSRIRLSKTLPTNPLIPLDALGLDHLTFTLTNPPFHPSLPSLLASTALKSLPPNSACTGAPHELITPGGEVAFVSGLISESVVLRTRVQWYTTLLGKLSSVSEVVETLKEVGVTNWAVVEFVQGRKTRRWGVAWSWGGRRPPVEIARGIPGLRKELLPFPSETGFVPPGAGREDVARRVDAALEGLDLRWLWRRRGEAKEGVGFAGGNVWSRAARRGRGRRGERGSGVGGNGEGGGGSVGNGEEEEEDEEKTDDDDDDDDEEEEAALGFKIQIREVEGGAGEQEQERVEVLVRWLQGHESVLWESFCGWLKRKLLTSA